MAAFDTRTGERIWDKPMLPKTRPAIIDSKIYSQGGCWDLASGELIPFLFKRTHGCGQISSGANMLLFRSATLAYFDLTRAAGHRELRRDSPRMLDQRHSCGRHGVGARRRGQVRLQLPDARMARIAAPGVTPYERTDSVIRCMRSWERKPQLGGDCPWPGLPSSIGRATWRAPISDAIFRSCPRPSAWDTGKEVGFALVPMAASPLTGGALRPFTLRFDDRQFTPREILFKFYGRSHLTFGWRTKAEQHLTLPWDHLGEYCAAVVEDALTFFGPGERPLAYVLGWMTHLVGGRPDQVDSAGRDVGSGGRKVHPEESPRPRPRYLSRDRPKGIEAALAGPAGRPGRDSC